MYDMSLQVETHQIHIYIYEKIIMYIITVQLDLNLTFACVSYVVQSLE